MKELQNLNISNILFLDIETVPMAKDYEGLDQTWKTLWDAKAKWLIKDEQTSKDVYERAGIYSEFGKIVCISAGFLVADGIDFKIRIKSFYGDDETLILQEFGAMIDKNFNSPAHYLCAHNGKEFDFPYIARRMIINGVEIPNKLDISGKKPWEVSLLDTLELWKFGDYKKYTSLKLLAASFGIPSPKDDMDGSEVAGYYWDKKDVESIKIYCEKDVLALAQVFLKYRGNFASKITLNN